MKKYFLKFLEISNSYPTTESSPSVLPLNNISRLNRWTRNALNEPCDCLEIEFKFVTGIKGGRSYPITARNYDGVMIEIEMYTRQYLAECVDQTIKNIKNGYME